MKKHTPYYLRRFQRPRHWYEIDWPLAGMGALNAVLWVIAVAAIVFVLLDAAGRSS